MLHKLAILAIVAALYLNGIPASRGQAGLNLAGEPRYGALTFVPGFTPAPFALDVVSGGDIAVKPLALADNCLGYAAADPDVVVELAPGFERVTFLVASAADTTLIINLPNGSWSCNDDTNGLNPALVYYQAAPGAYQIWIGSYASDSYDQAALYVAETGPEALPTTATGPDPARNATYGEATLAPFFQPAPFTAQFLGGGRNQVADFLDGPSCHGFVAEAPDFSVILSEDFPELYFAAHSPADITLLINSADGSWHCAHSMPGGDPTIGFSHAAAGLYDVWVGSAEAGNYSASVFYVMESAPNPPPEFTIDASCPGLPDTRLQVGGSATVAQAQAAMYAVPETAATVIYRPPLGTALALIAGPVCKGTHRWWRAELSDGARGWIADGDGDSAWLSPAN